MSNLEKSKIGLLRAIRKERKYIVVAADKNLGPCMLEIEQCINMCLDDHINKKETHMEFTGLDAVILNEDNFHWVCKVFTVKPPKELPEDNHQQAKQRGISSALLVLLPTEMGAGRKDLTLLQNIYILEKPNN